MDKLNDCYSVNLVNRQTVDLTGLTMQHIASKKKPRGASAYNKRYSKAFKSLAPKYKTKKGAWKKNGYRSCVRAAHKKARK